MALRHVSARRKEKPMRIVHFENGGVPGIAAAAHPTELEARREYERIWSQLGIRAIEDLIDLPLMWGAFRV